MKKRQSLLIPLSVLVMTISLYLVFYTRIESKPNHAGFWIILVMGMSVGVFLTRFIQGLEDKDKK